MIWGIGFVCSVILCIYILFIISIIYGWHKISMPEFSETNFSNEFFVSIVIPFRDEKTNLPEITECLRKQQVSIDRFEIIFVDDHSSDDSYNLLQEITCDMSNVKIIRNGENEHGKKAAIANAIKIANGNLIITADADVKFGNDWLASIAGFYKQYKPQMMICPVKFQGQSLIEDIFSLEFLSIAAVTAGSAGIGKPLMCNGANLAFEKSIYEKNAGVLNISDPSGDDMYLLQEIKKDKKNKILFLKSKRAIATTPPPKNLSAFISQRIRWAGKNQRFTDMEIKFSAVVVFITNLIIPISLLLSVWNIFFFWLFIILLSVKSVFDIIAIFQISEFYGQRKLMLYFPLLMFIYPFYVSHTGLSSFFVPYQWKDRQVKQTI